MNAARGETVLTVDGAEVPLCLTLGGLAELEHAFGCQSLTDLQLRLKHLSATELTKVLAILAKGAGAKIAMERVAPLEAARAIADAFHAALG
ncbi:MAG: gene transfer agent family protein [Hyphomonadaceae bacterium]|nr:gene transfer agent family protein [Hyphomonadaceae bacterium]